MPKKDIARNRKKDIEVLTTKVDEYARRTLRLIQKNFRSQHNDILPYFEARKNEVKKKLSSPGILVKDSEMKSLKEEVSSFEKYCLSVQKAEEWFVQKKQEIDDFVRRYYAEINLHNKSLSSGALQQIRNKVSSSIRLAQSVLEKNVHRCVTSPTDYYDFDLIDADSLQTQMNVYIQEQLSISGNSELSQDEARLQEIAKLRNQNSILEKRFDEAVKKAVKSRLRLETAKARKEVLSNKEQVIQEEVNKRMEREMASTLKQKDNEKEEELKLQKVNLTKAMGEIESEYKSFINELKRNQEETQQLHEQKIRLLEAQLKETVATYETLFAKKYKEEIEKRAKEIAAEYLKKEFPFE